jgi:hypothetical protein
VADTLPNVSLPKGGQWVDLYTATSIPVGTALEITSINAVGVNIAISPTQPDDDSGYETIKTETSNYIGSGASGAWARSGGGTSINVSIQNPSRNTVTTISSLEASIGDGNGYALTIEIVVPNAETVYYVLKTPADKIVRIKGRSISTGGGMRYEPMIDGIYALDADITPGTIRNLNGNVPNSTGVQLWTVTGVTDGEPIDVVRTPTASGGSGNPVTYSSPGSERVLSKDTEYLLKFDNIDNTEIWCIYSLVWSETIT